MQLRVKTYFLASALVLLTAAYSPAGVMYQYIGPDFNDSAQQLTSPYHLTIDLITPALLTSYSWIPSNNPDLLNIEYLNLSWNQLKMSDGLSTITGPAGQFSLAGDLMINALDSSGLPAEWSIGASRDGVQMYSCYLFHSISDFRDQSGYPDGTGGGNYWTLGAGGHWSIVDNAQVPEPGTFLLLSAGLLGLALSGRKMKRA
jgi:hypothetical protein